MTAGRKLAYSRDEAAEMLSISPSTLDKLVREGELNPRLIGTKRLFLEADLVAFAEALPKVR